MIQNIIKKNKLDLSQSVTALCLEGSMDSKNAHESVINLVSTYLIKNKYEALDDGLPTFREKMFKVRKNQ